MRILITGPESTGKTSTALKLAEQFNFQLIPEYARTYLEKNGPDYTYDGLLTMAKEHFTLSLGSPDKDLILDTYMLNFKIWFLHKFGRYPDFIDEVLKQTKFDLVLLMSPDIEWEFDALRENKNDREELFKQYENELQVLKWPYHIIRGQGNARIDLCKKLINDCMIKLN